MALSTASVAVVHRLSSPRGQAVSISGILARSAVRFGALAALLLGQPACRPSAAPAGGTHIVDDAGDTVVVPAAARRVVSLIPATTELLFAIGAGPAVVGRTAWCDYPAAAAKVPNLGDGIAPNVEAVLASRPDLVILYNSAQNADIAARLRRLGIAALRLNTDSLGDVDRVGRLLGRLTGHARAADSVAAVFDTALAAATAPAPRAPAQGAAARLGTAPHDDRSRELPERAGRARGRAQSLCGRHVERGNREHRGGRVT